MALVRGANAPLLQKTIREQLQAEKIVLAEGRERRVVSGQPTRVPQARPAGASPAPPMSSLSLESCITCPRWLGASEGSGEGASPTRKSSLKSSPSSRTLYNVFYPFPFHPHCIS